MIETNTKIKKSLSIFIAIAMIFCLMPLTTIPAMATTLTANNYIEFAGYLSLSFVTEIILTQTIEIPDGAELDGHNVIIKADPSFVPALQVSGATNIYPLFVVENGSAKFSNMKIDGSGTGTYTSGIFAAGDVELNNVSIQGMHMGTEINGVQNGYGLFVVGDADATVTNCVFAGIQKGFIIFKSNGNLTVTGSSLTGIGSTGVIAQNAIQVSSGTALIDNNTISGFTYAPQTYVSTAILIAGGEVEVTNNVIDNIDIGVCLNGVCEVKVYGNTITGAVWDPYYSYTPDTAIFTPDSDLYFWAKINGKIVEEGETIYSGVAIDKNSDIEKPDDATLKIIRNGVSYTQNSLTSSAYTYDITVSSGGEDKLSFKVLVDTAKPALSVKPTDFNGEALANNKWTYGKVDVELVITNNLNSGNENVIFYYGETNASNNVDNWSKLDGNVLKLSADNETDLTVGYKFKAVSKTDVESNESSKWTFNFDNRTAVVTVPKLEDGFTGYGANVILSCNINNVKVDYTFDGEVKSKTSNASIPSNITLSEVAANSDGTYSDFTVFNRAGKPGNIVRANKNSALQKFTGKIIINKAKPVLKVDPSVPTNTPTDKPVIVTLTATPDTGLTIRYQMKTTDPSDEWTTITSANGKTGTKVTLSEKATYQFRAVNNVSGVASATINYNGTRINVTNPYWVRLGDRTISIPGTYYFDKTITKADRECPDGLVLGITDANNQPVTGNMTNGAYTVIVNEGSTEVLTFNAIVDSVKPAAPKIEALDKDDAVYKTNTWTNGDVSLRLYMADAATPDSRVDYYEVSSDGGATYDKVESGDTFFVSSDSPTDFTATYKFRAVSKSGIIGNESAAFIVKIVSAIPTTVEITTARNAGYDGYPSNITLKADNEGVNISYEFYNFADSTTKVFTDVSFNKSTGELVLNKGNGEYTNISIKDKGGNEIILYDDQSTPVTSLTVDARKPIMTLKATKVSPLAAGTINNNQAGTDTAWIASNISIDLSSTSDCGYEFEYSLDKGISWNKVTGTYTIEQPTTLDEQIVCFRAVNSISGVASAEKVYTAYLAPKQLQ